MREKSPASQQFFDRAIGAQQAVTASTFNSCFVDGTIFPLLPYQALRIFNASSQIFCLDTSGKLNVTAANIYLQFYDSSKNKIQAPSILLASLSPANPGVLLNSQAGGVCLDADGDPIIEIVSNMFVSGVAAAGGPTIANFSVSASAEVTNTDGSNPHTVYQIMAALFAWVALR